MKEYTVYMHIAPNGKKYIGITKRNPNIRFGMNGQNYKKDTHFGRAIEKYGWDSFEHIILESNLSEEDAKRREKELIESYKTYDSEFGYNMTLGGEGNIPTQETRKKLSRAQMGNKKALGRKYSTEQRRILSESQKGRTFTEETKKKMRNAAMGKTISPETKEKISKSLIGNKRSLGYKHDELFKEKISKSLIGNTRCLGYKHTDETRQKMSESSNTVSVIQLNHDGSQVMQYSSIREAGEKTGARQQNIWAVCNGIGKTAGGYIWKYAKGGLA